MIVVCNICTTLFVIELRYVVEIGSSDDAVFASKIRCTDNRQQQHGPSEVQSCAKRRRGSVCHLSTKVLTRDYLTSKRQVFLFVI